MQQPDKEGFWKVDDTIVEVYSLDPVGGILCIWGPDVGNTYTGATDTQFPWDNDEWQGHIPANMYAPEREWIYLRAEPIDELNK